MHEIERFYNRRFLGGFQLLEICGKYLYVVIDSKGYSYLWPAVRAFTVSK